MPVMNMIDAEVADENGAVLLKFAGQKIKVDQEKADVLREGGYIGKEVTIGIRPENISEYNGEGDSDIVLDVETSVFEMLGSEGLLYFNLNDANWVASVSPDLGVKVGDRVTLAVDLARMHIFDKDTEESLVK